MSKKYPGGILSKTVTVPTGPYQDGAASGMWSMEDVVRFKQQGVWPIAGNAVPYIEDVFSTHLYDGNSSTQTITNNIDLSGQGGLVWIKSRNTATDNALFDTARGASNGFLKSNATDTPYASPSSDLTSFGASGFSLNNTTGNVNVSSRTYASWTFRKQPKFFDVVSYTGNGVAGREIAHNLGSAPGCIIVKCTSDVEDWKVYHRSLGSGTGNGVMRLNTTAIDQGTGYGKYNWGDNTNFIAPTSTVFTVATDGSVNANGRTYVAYLWAHDAGGFGLAGTDNVVSCGSVTADASGGATVNLGYEPQWIMYKMANRVTNWTITDTMRGWVTQTTVNPRVYANATDAESTSNDLGITSTGFNSLNNHSAGDIVVYIAIRKGPMKVPTLGTSVYTPVSYTGITSTVATPSAGGFSPDMFMSLAYGGIIFDKVRGRVHNMKPSSTNADASHGTLTSFDQNGVTLPYDGTYGYTNSGGTPYIYNFFKRAPGFFDIVAYTGASQQNITHNLKVAPELVIVKRRSTAGTSWATWATSLTADESLALNTSDSKTAVFSVGFWGSTYPTSSVFTVGSNTNVNGSGQTFIAYLFATLAGVSKVGSYTGTGALQTVACGFTSGARFILIKRTDTTGDWYLFNSASGISGGNDPYFLLNTENAVASSTNYVDTDSTGFKVTAAAPAGLNYSGGTYIFLAIA